MSEVVLGASQLASHLVTLPDNPPRGVTKPALGGGVLLKLEAFEGATKEQGADASSYVVNLPTSGSMRVQS